MSLRYQLLTLLGVLLIFFSLSCEKSPPVSSGYTNVSLIVSTFNFSEYSRLEQLTRYDFSNGELISSETILNRSGGNPQFDDSRLYKDRYVLSNWGTIADIETGEVIYSGGCDVKNARIKGTDDEVLVIYSEDTDEYYSYELEKRKCSLLTEPTRWALPGFISPDGTKSITVELGGWGCNEILLHTLDGSNTSLGINFCEQLSELSSQLPAVPVMWLDNQSFITQVSNGEVVVVSTDGTIEPIVTINLTKEFHPNTLELGMLHPQFSTDPKGNIVYELGYAYHPTQEPGANVKWFIIDTVNKSYSPCCTEWINIGYGFEITAVAYFGSNRSVRYNGSDIGQACFSLYYAKTTEGYIALSHHITVMRVWSSANQEWTTIDYGSSAQVRIIGWIK